MAGTFVYAVCGSREHLDSLHLSLVLLRHFSKSDIIVVTDSSRNEIPIEHSKIIDVETPKDFNNHQAGIYLKTSLHRILPRGPKYCYLDTDVFAVRSGVDDLFKLNCSPVLFAPDVGYLRMFSPYAVRCGCVEKFTREQREFQELRLRFQFCNKTDSAELLHRFRSIKELKTAWVGSEDWKLWRKSKMRSRFAALNTIWYKKHRIKSKKVLEQRRKLDQLVAEWKKDKPFSPDENGFKEFFAKEGFVLDRKKRIWYDAGKNIIYDFENEYNNFMIRHGFTRGKHDQRWYDKDGNTFCDEATAFANYCRGLLGLKRDLKSSLWYDWDGSLVHDDSLTFDNYLANNSQFIWSPKLDCWVDADGNNFYDILCDHLIDAIRKRFDVEVTDRWWKNWNGGVYLFNGKSEQFLDTWHNWTMNIFNDPHWRTRDQGTLISTIWKFGLQKKKKLPVIFNFLADYFSFCPGGIEYRGNFKFAVPGEQTLVAPKLLHIYHHAGDRKWRLWNDIERLATSIKKSKAKRQVTEILGRVHEDFMIDTDFQPGDRA